jgi:hypothetical protein
VRRKGIGTRTPHAGGGSAMSVLADQSAVSDLHAGVASSRSRWQRITNLMRQPPWLAPLLVLTPFVGAAWWVERFDPTDNTPDPTGPCLWHAATGINGPGCGGTRMFYYLIHGDLVQAARFHLPALLAVPVLAYLWLRWTLARVFGVQLPALRLSKGVLIGYGIFFVVFSTVLRNLPFAPFHWFDIPNLADRIT